MSDVIRSSDADHERHGPRHAILYRDPDLVRAILEYLNEVASDTVGARERRVAWVELVDVFTGPKHHFKTVENVLYDLATFGAIARNGRPNDRKHGDTRNIAITTLGQHWLDGTTPPTMKERHHDNP